MSYIGKNPPFITIPADDAVTTAMLQDDAVTADKVANAINTSIAANTSKVTNATHTGDVTGATALTIAVDAVDIAMLSATGTASSSTFLRGDNAWADAAYYPTPMWFAYANSDQTGVSDATWTKVTNLGAEAIDSDGAYATGTQTFTVPADKAGKYYIYGSVVPGSGGTSTMNSGGAAIYVDGVKYADFVMDLQANPGFKIAAHVSAIIDLAVGEAVTIYGYGDMTAGSPAFYSSGFTKAGRFFGWRLSA